MKTNLFLFLGLAMLCHACNDAPRSNPQPEIKPPSAPVPPPIDPAKDFELESTFGIINGSAEPQAVRIEDDKRYFDFGKVEVKTQGHASLSGEKISYCIRETGQWREVPDEDFLFFIGFDGNRHLILDRGTETAQREIRLFDLSSEKTAYSGEYNNSLQRDSWLYVLRYARPEHHSTLPDCSKSAVPPGQPDYEEAIAISLEKLEEYATGQVFCAAAR